MAGGREAHRVGVRGEAIAALALERRGLTVIARNYRCPGGEIDLVARDGTTLVFVEVKSRAANNRPLDEDLIGPQKRRRLVRASMHYIAGRHTTPGGVRFDVVWVELKPDGGARTRHLVDAFDLQEIGP